MAELGVSRSALTSQIRPLVEAGLLIPETDPENTNAVGGRNRRRWRVDPDAINAAIEDFRRSVTGRH
jgi:DNA-binding MarR family transcriptional regulator